MLLAVSDIEAARSELIAHGVDASQVFHCAPNRRRSLVEEDSTHVIVGWHGSY
jgi:hypothetical protein